MDLREQVRAIAVGRFVPEFVLTRSFPELCKDLAVKAFIEGWPDGVECRAVRKALFMLQEYGAVPIATPPAE